ncbi:hypothetical protein DAPPUDRAFT_120025 [Daphnia pulex]|uniref:Uncharacterized protein n=1 Tax=Daphnia pulex TaxID=6669 RepID=E9I038_DAPPU|nr:hypothetical protein DAPPUDRAFT_120025 [Daphnia pulex]|eukprot:EFX62642.1 hypothetical protein DAPPUDRAFT_120025 [Daphnia pulex]
MEYRRTWETVQNRIGMYGYGEGFERWPGAGVVSTLGSHHNHGRTFRLNYFWRQIIALNESQVVSRIPSEVPTGGWNKTVKSNELQSTLYKCITDNISRQESSDEEEAPDGSDMGNINERQCEGQEDNVEEVGIEPGTFAYNTGCYNHYIMVAYPDLTISSSGIVSKWHAGNPGSIPIEAD